MCNILLTAGDIQGFTDTYLEGLALQCQEQRTVSKDTVEIHRQALPYDVYMRIFSYLSVKDLGYAMAVSKVTARVNNPLYLINTYLDVVHHVHGWTVMV